MNEDFIKEALYSPEANPLFLALVLGVAFILGAIHALGPGHGKSLMAAYLVGVRGKIKDAIILALSITFSHVFSVIVIGFVVFLLMNVFWSEKISLWLGVISGIFICAIGLWLLIQRLHLYQVKQKTISQAPRHPVLENFHHDHHHHHSHANHTHRHSYNDSNLSLWSNISLGISSGIVPCPKALVILLLAISLQKIILGITIITVFSLGMALVLMAIGITLVKASHLLKDRFQSKWTQLLPVLGSIIIIALGLVITLRTVQLL